MKKTLPPEEILRIAKEIIKDDLENPTENESLSKRSQRILNEWKERCWESDPNLVFTTPDPIEKRFQFALHDRKNGIVYELKVNTNSAIAFRDKLFRKLMLYNTLTLKDPEIDHGEFAEKIAGKDYRKIKEAHILGYKKVLTGFQSPLVQRFCDVLKLKFGVRIILHSLD